MTLPDELNADWFARFRRNLKRWYARHGRDLPWRRSADAYRIWISEIMLQQTTVAAVIPYYERFLKRFPDVASLAASDEEDVLRLWEGLGYYSRARNIHKAARQILDEHNGRFPVTADELQQLPGIGRYTAGAIASFAFDQPAPILEANTLRLYCRLLGYADDPRARTGQALLWHFAERVLPRTEPGRLNQALMELGGTICSVRDPACELCPVKSCCRAFAQGTQGSIPQPKRRPTVTQLTHANLLVRKHGRVLVRQHSADERWAGLWDFPRYELKESPGDPPAVAGLRRTLQEQLREQTGVEAMVEDSVTELSHSVTRYRIRLICFGARYVSGRLRRGEPLRWVTPGQLRSLPLSMTARKLAKFVAAATPVGSGSNGSNLPSADPQPE